jgi:AcrR family transcriptional regulator
VATKSTPRAVKDGEGSRTREQMIDAAIDCILEVGFYRATSNEIARHAGLTWGAIQRQFGSREALMLAVHEQEWQQLVAALRKAHIEGESARERIGSLVGALESYYSRREFFAALQVTMNLRKDPKTSAAAHETIRRLSIDAEAAGTALVRQVFAGNRIDPVLATFIFYSIRDFFVGIHIESTTALEETLTRRLRSIKREKVLLVDALTAVVEAPSAVPRRRAPARTTPRTPRRS